MKDTFVYTPHVQEGILLNANELSENLNGEIITRIQAMIPEILFNRYPDDTYAQLLDAYASAMNLKPEQLICGNGSDQMLGLLIGSFLGKGKTLYTFAPDFGMYDYYASSYEADVARFDLDMKGGFDVNAFIEKGKAVNPDMILFSNPNNPTGMQVSRTDVETILHAFPDIPVVLDEAYMEFGDQSMLYETEMWPNLYVTRTLSKAYGLAGLRVGFLITSVENAAVLRPKKVVYALNTLSAAIAAMVLDYKDQFLEKAADTARRRDVLYEILRGFSSLNVLPSKANFLCISADRIEDLKKAFDEAGIVVRDYPGKDYLRLTIGLPEEMDAARAVLETFEGEVYAQRK